MVVVVVDGFVVVIEIELVVDTAEVVVVAGPRGIVVEVGVVVGVVVGVLVEVVVDTVVVAAVDVVVGVVVPEGLYSRVMESQS